MIQVQSLNIKKVLNLSLPKYIINFEELTEDLKNHLLSLIDDNIRTNYPEVNTNNIQDLLQQLKDLLPNVQYEGLKEKIDSFIYRKIEGIQKVKGILLDMPAIQMITRNNLNLIKMYILQDCILIKQAGKRMIDTV